MRTLLTLTVILSAACTEAPTPGTTAYGCPSAHAEPMEACYALLADAFPNTPRDSWAIEECGDLGVLALDTTGVDTRYAVTTSGDAYLVSECQWTHL